MDKSIFLNSASDITFAVNATMNENRNLPDADRVFIQQHLSVISRANIAIMDRISLLHCILDHRDTPNNIDA
jgi:hypothetical protein